MTSMMWLSHALVVVGALWAFGRERRQRALRDAEWTIAELERELAVEGEETPDA